MYTNGTYYHSGLNTRAIDNIYLWVYIIGMVILRGLYPSAVDTLIRSITGPNEDVAQDVWVELLERNIVDLDEIAIVAKATLKKHSNAIIRDKFKVRSLDAPLNTKDGDAGFTLKDVIGTEDATPGVSQDVNHHPLWKVTANVFLDKETASVLRSKYPAPTLRDSIRLALGLSPLGYQFKRGNIWQPWELGILRKYYPYGGYEAVKDRLNNRTFLAVRSRTSHMKLRLISYNPLGQFLTTEAVVSNVGISRWWLTRLKDNGLLIPTQCVFNGRSMQLYERELLIKFLLECPFKYPHWLVKDTYKQYIPKGVSRWLPIDVVAKIDKLHKGTILRRVKSGLLRSKVISHFHLVNRDDAINICSQRLPHRSLIRVPYRVISMGLVSHYVHHTSLNDVGNTVAFLLCDKNGTRYKTEYMRYLLPYWCSPSKRSHIIKARMLRTAPTCKVCLAMGRKLKREILQKHEQITKT